MIRLDGYPSEQDERDDDRSVDGDRALATRSDVWIQAQEPGPLAAIVSGLGSTLTAPSAVVERHETIVGWDESGVMSFSTLPLPGRWLIRFA